MWLVPFYRWENQGQDKQLFPQICVALHWNHRDLNPDLLALVLVLLLPSLASPPTPLSQGATLIGEPNQCGVWVCESSETGLLGGLSLTSLWPSVSCCTSRSLASRASCIWELRAKSRESLWRAERSQTLWAGSPHTSAPPGPGVQDPSQGGSLENFLGSDLDCGNKETEAPRAGWLQGTQ